MLGCHPPLLIVCLREKSTSTKTPVLAIIFRVPMTSVSPYRNLHISGESRRIKATKRPYFIASMRRFIFRSQKQFYAFIFTSYFHDDVMITSPKQAKCSSWRWALKYFWDRQTAFKEAFYYKSSLCFLRTALSRWATRALELNLRLVTVLPVAAPRIRRFTGRIRSKQEHPVRCQV
jgi:hypothetical protein